MMKKYTRILLVLFSWISVFPLMAENTTPSTDFTHGRHSLRLGWGLGTCQLFHDYHDLNFIMPPSNMQGIHKSALPEDPYYQIWQLIQGMTAEQAHKYLMDYCRVITDQGPNQFGHLFLGYRYDVNTWFSAGVEADWFYLWASQEHRNGYGTLVGKYDSQLHQLTIMPTVRFTYYHHPLVELYSGLGLGYTLYADPYVSHGFTFSPTLLGVNVGNEHWFAEMELGGMATVTTSWFGNPGLLFSSRLLSVAVGYRF